MQEQASTTPLNSGFRDFFTPPYGDRDYLRVSGIGLREGMTAGMVQRPNGRKDWLIMLFHDAAIIAADDHAQSLQSPDSLMLWPPGSPHHYGNPETPFCHSWIHCDGQRIESIIANSGIPVAQPLKTIHTNTFSRGLLDVHNELMAWTKPDMVLIGNMLEIMIREISRSLNQDPRNQRIPAKLLKVRRLMADPAAPSLSLEQMAVIAGMSTSHFCAEFKRHFSLPPGECLIRQRMQFAAHLLSDQSLNIAAVGQRVGYDDAFHFSKMFKKVHGVSPRQYRRGLQHSGQREATD